MSLILDQKSLTNTLTPALIIAAGVMFKNGGKQYGGQTTNKSKILGMAMFIGGWIGLTWGLVNGLTGPSFYLPIIACVGIMGSAVAMSFIKDSDDKLPTWGYIFVAIFAICWVMLGYSVAMDKGLESMAFGMIAAACVIFSMVILLPWQRKNGVVDGPGMALFVIGLLMLSYAKAVPADLQN